MLNRPNSISDSQVECVYGGKALHAKYKRDGGGGAGVWGWGLGGVWEGRFSAKLPLAPGKPQT